MFIIIIIIIIIINIACQYWVIITLLENNCYLDNLSIFYTTWYFKGGLHVTFVEFCIGHNF